MTKIDLPDGVPFDNEGKSSLSGAPYRAPNVATPQFEGETPNLDHKTHHVGRGEFSAIIEDDDRGDDNEFHPRGRGVIGGNVAIVIAVAALLAALGAIVIANTQGDTPLCTSQPLWNQYNCRAG